MNIVLMEDEQMLADELAQYIQAVRKDWKIVRILKSVKEAVEYLSANQDCQLIFSDIELGDGLSFSVFQQVKIGCPVIFCTAYNRYAIEAFKNHGIDYILKPIGRNAIEEAIGRYESLKASLSPAIPDYTSILSQLTVQKTDGSILVSHRDKIIPIRIDDIALFFIANGLVCLKDFQKNKYIVNYTLDELESMCAEKFYRADRQHLVNRKTIRDVTQYHARKLQINLTIDHADIITIRKEKTADFLKWLQQ